MTNVAILGEDEGAAATVAAALTAARPPFTVAFPPTWAPATQWAGAILVLDANDGITGRIREVVQDAVRHGVSKVVLYLSNAAAVEDDEILELTEMECQAFCERELPHDAYLGAVRSARNGAHEAEAIAKLVAVCAPLARG